MARPFFATYHSQPPSWDCDWYWGFGYLQNSDVHYHVDGLCKTHNTNMFDALKEEFGKTLTITKDADLWIFCELMQTFYTLKQAAEVLGRGGSNYTSNPCEEVIKDTAYTTRINEMMLPAVFDALDSLLVKYR